jgi:uncharacterized repeat protein (TIGR01451 family)
MKSLLRRHPAGPHRRPRLEFLEDRCLPSVTPAGPAFLVSGTIFNPTVAIDNNADFVVAGTVDSPGSAIMAHRFNAAQTAQGLPYPLALNFPTGAGTSGVFQVAAAGDNAGDFILAWPLPRTTANPQVGIEWQRFAANGTPIDAAPTPLLAPTQTASGGFTDVDASVAMDGRGDFVVAIDSDQSGAPEQVLVEAFNASGVRTLAPTPLQLPSGNTFGLSAFPSLAMDAAGDFVAAWKSGSEVVTQRFVLTPVGNYEAGGVRNIAALTSGVGSQVRPSVATDAAGDYVVVWKDGQTSFAQRVPVGATLPGVIIVGGSLTAQPAVGMDAQGDFTVAFLEFGANNDLILAQPYDQSGNPQPLIQVASLASGASPDPGVAIAMNAAGSFAVAWDQFFVGDGSWARLFLANGSVPPPGVPNVTVTKTTDTPTVNAGQAADFTVTIKNKGTDTATGVTFSDPLPGNDIIWSIKSQSPGNPFSISGSGPGGQSLTFTPTTLAAGASDTVEITGTTTFNDACCPAFIGTLVNTATVSATNEPTADQNQTASATVTVVTPEVTVLKTADQLTVSAGRSAGFTVTVSNIGTSAAAGVTLSDPLPAGAGNDIKWQIASDSGNAGDFAITGAVGSQVLTLAPGVTSLAAGQSLSVHVTGLTSFADVPDPGDGASLFNTATVSATNEAPDDQNQQASATIKIVTPDVTIFKAAEQPTISAGQTAAFILFLNNAGGLTATGVTLSDPLPAGPGNDVNWRIDPSSFSAGDFVITGAVGSQVLTLAPGVTSLNPNQLLIVNVIGETSAADAPAPALIGFLANTVTVSAANEPPAAQNQQSSATITIIPDGVTVLKSADQPFISAGQTAGFTVAVFNVSGNVATGVTLNDPLPAGPGNDLFWVIGPNSLDPGDFVITGSLGSQVLTLAPGVTSLNPGQSLSVDVTAPTGFADAPGFNGVLSNTATVNAANEPATAQNQQSSATITISTPDVTVAKTADQTLVAAGTSAGFTVTVSNVGTATATGVTLNDPLPAGLGNDVNWQIDSDPLHDFVITGAVGSQVLTLAPGVTSLDPNQLLIVNVTGLTSAADAPGSLPNTATVSAGNEAPALQNQKSSATIEVLVPDIAVTDTLTSSSQVDAGQPVSFVVSVSNVGKTTLTNVVLSDLLPTANGSANHFNWVIDTTTGNPTDFAINCTPSMTQSLNFAGGLSLNPGQTLAVRVIGVPTSLDAGPSFSANLTSSIATVTAVNEPTVRATAGPITVLAPDLTVTKTTSHFFIGAGQSADFTVTLSNSLFGHATATGVTLTDPLPPGAGNDVNWRIDPGTGNPGDFVITGTVGHQTLTLAPGITTLPVGTTLMVRITGLTTSADAPASLSGNVTVFQGSLQNTATVTANGLPPDQASSFVLVVGESSQSTPSPTPNFRFITGTPSSSSSASSNLLSGNAASIVAALSQPAGAASDNGALAPPIDLGIDLNAAAPVTQPPAPPESPPGSGGAATTLTTLSGAGGTARVGDISGLIFLDRNGNGVREAGETGIAGMTVFIDMHGDGRFHPDDPYTVTNEQGEYVFRNLPLNRTYQVRPTRQQYLAQTYPQKDAAQIVQLSDDHPTQTDVTFGTVPFKPATSPIRTVGDPMPPMPPPPAPPEGDPGKLDRDQSRNDVPPEESDAVFGEEAFWGPVTLPLALAAAFALGMDRRRRRRSVSRWREESV